MNKPTLTHIESNAIWAYGYDPDAQELHVQFLRRENGEKKPGVMVYQYGNFTPDDLAKLESADSKGSHILKVVKPGHELKGQYPA